MKVLVCGSRTWRDGDAIRQRLAQLPRGSEIVHGDARGADKLAGLAADALGLRQIRMPADWRRFGPGAGLRRNLEMLGQKPDLVIAFWDGASTGTAHTIAHARRRGMKVEVVMLA